MKPIKLLTFTLISTLVVYGAVQASPVQLSEVEDEKVRFRFPRCTTLNCGPVDKSQEFPKGDVQSVGVGPPSPAPRSIVGDEAVQGQGAASNGPLEARQGEDPVCMHRCEALGYPEGCTDPCCIDHSRDEMVNALENDSRYVKREQVGSLIVDRREQDGQQDINASREKEEGGVLSGVLQHRAVFGSRADCINACEKVGVARDCKKLCGQNERQDKVLKDDQGLLSEQDMTARDEQDRIASSDLYILQHRKLVARDAKKCYRNCLSKGASSRHCSRHCESDGDQDELSMNAANLNVKELIKAREGEEGVAVRGLYRKRDRGDYEHDCPFGCGGRKRQEEALEEKEGDDARREDESTVLDTLLGRRDIQDGRLAQNNLNTRDEVEDSASSGLLQRRQAKSNHALCMASCIRVAPVSDCRNRCHEPPQRRDELSTTTLGPQDKKDFVSRDEQGGAVAGSLYRHRPKDPSQDCDRCHLGDNGEECPPGCKRQESLLMKEDALVKRVHQGTDSLEYSIERRDMLDV